LPALSVALISPTPAHQHQRRPTGFCFELRRIRSIRAVEKTVIGKSVPPVCNRQPVGPTESQRHENGAKPPQTGWSWKLQLA
jgi:hypothetical protein